MKRKKNFLDSTLWNKGDRYFGKEVTIEVTSDEKSGRIFNVGGKLENFLSLRINYDKRN